MRQHKDVVIKNISAPEVSALLPEWYRQRIVAGPLCRAAALSSSIRKRWDSSTSMAMRSGVRLLTPALLNYLKVLRGQAVVAIRQKSMRPESRRK